ncbi:sigma-54-dependent transcriptional regulator [Luteolibacter luteus]|uniref:Sigma-54-dependent Fis family transcriptional regulator n=1 Tax=Luteolibacter luteus TaxID=2728835 RepID=A0A858RMK1_9BACT|nr:sigma-54 dependent transcriptional regulator [Luteolibacter luteus]QJE97213.1 sigma-54-dependent Fis family transcriptional regulator [Luteolibacter luteus]
MARYPSDAPNLLIVDDDSTIQRLLEFAAKDHGWRPVAAGTGNHALELLDEAIEAVVLDHGLPDVEGMEVLSRIRDRFPDLPVIMLTGLNDAETAVKALRAGAADYLTKPFELKRLFDILREIRRERKEIPAPAATSTLPGSSVKATKALTSASPKVRELLRRLEKAAALNSTILLTGESGTGKTYFAREIHRLSPRSTEDFITVSCPALPRELLESELFGHERGSFTGATSSRAGRFEQASKGTLFLDEIGDLPAELQPKLLNVLQDREFFRVGGNKLLKTDTRVIAATNVDLRARVNAGGFREDLYYRLNIIELHIPPLRERKEDIEGLAGDILKRIAQRRGVEGWQLSEAAGAALLAFDWPGNVRQLENVLERATAFTDGTALGEKDLAPLLETRRDGPLGSSGRPLTLQEMERDVFIQTYHRSGKNKAKTARELGISERSVYNLLERHGLK